DAHQQVLVVIRERQRVEPQDGRLRIDGLLESGAERAVERFTSRKERADAGGSVPRSEIVAGDLRISFDGHLGALAPDPHDLALGIRVLPAPQTGALEVDLARFTR